jgi:hypothetical protein
MNWWAGLCALAAFNILLWVVSYRAFAFRKTDLGSAISGRRWHLYLSAIYVMGCAQRMIWPKVDVQRFCLIDSWLSSIFLGRSIATIAELCFAAQWALLLWEYSKEAKFSMGKKISYLIVPLIFTAQLCCWYSVISTSFLGHVIEESIWAFTALLVTICVAHFWRHSASHRGFLGSVLALGLCYFLYMTTVDVPMYVIRWREELALARPLLSLESGLSDVLSRRIVTYRWEDWASEISWLSLYFSLAVWASIGFAHAPRYKALKD